MLRTWVNYVFQLFSIVWICFKRFCALFSKINALFNSLPNYIKFGFGIQYLWILIVLVNRLCNLFLGFELHQICLLNPQYCNSAKFHEKVGKINQADHYLLESLKESVVSPCYDFDEHVCGKFRKDHPISLFENLFKNRHLTPKDELMKKSAKCYKDALASNFTNPSNAVTIMQIYRDKYFEPDKTNSQNKEFLDEIEAFGSCPVFDKNWSEKTFNLTSMLNKMTKLTGQLYLFDMNLILLEGSKTEIVFEHQIMPKFVLDSKTVQQLELDATLIAKLFQLFDSKRPNSKKSNSNRGYLKTARKVVKLRNQLHKIENNTNLSVQKKFGLTYKDKLNLTNVFNLPELIPAIELSYFIANPIISPKLQTHFLTNSSVLVKKPLKFYEIGQFYSQTNNSTLVNYLCANYLIQQLPYMNIDLNIKENEVYSESSVSYFNAIYTLIYDLLKESIFELLYYFYMGFSNLESISTDAIFEFICGYFNKIINYYFTTNINNTIIHKHVHEKELKILIELKFPIIADYLYINQCFDVKSLKMADALVGDIKRSAQKILLENEWLDDESKSKLSLKLSKIKTVVGGYAVSRDIKKLDQYYSQLNFFTNDTLRQIENKLNLNNKMKELNLLVEPDKFLELYLDVRAHNYDSYHYVYFNTIFMPAASIFVCNYSDNLPIAFYYATVGFMVAHEVMHSFDSGGIKYSPFWSIETQLTPASISTFKNQSKCLIDQYNNVYDPQTHKYLNGTRTFDENLVDNAALRVAYYAFQNRSLNKTKALEFGQFSDEELFFYAYAMDWCAQKSKKYQTYVIDFDEHSPRNFRVNEVVKNMPEFSQAFKCSSKTKMNPEKKCKFY